MCDLTIEVLVDDCVNCLLEGYREADAEGCEIAQSQQDDLAYGVFMESWLGKHLTSLAEKSYDMGMADAGDCELLLMDPITSVVSKIEDAIYETSRDCHDSTDWWDVNHPYSRRTGSTFASKLMVKIKSILEESAATVGGADFANRIRWVKASERKPTKADADGYGSVIVRWDGDGKWIVMSLDFSDVSDYQEWLEGAFADKADGWDPDSEMGDHQ